MKKVRGIAALCLLVVLMMTVGCAKAGPVDLEEPVEQVPTAAELQAALEDVNATREVTLYYKDLAGYIVPVNCEIPWEEGIAKATLKQMVSSEQNDLQAARLGLLTALPEGLSVDMDIVGQMAKVSMSKDCMDCIDAEEENAMVCAIVSALTEFDTISEVQLLVNGEQVEELTYGTKVGAPIKRSDLNIESVSADFDPTGGGAVQVFFASESSGCMVPVTRTVFSNEDVDTAVLELLKGPKEGSGLVGCMPKGVGLISVKQKDGVVTINMSKEFKEVISQADGGQAAVKALVLTCSQFDGVKEVKLQVEGEDFVLDTETLAATTVVNTETEALMASAIWE